MRWLGWSFTESLENVWSVVSSRTPIALARFGDGELALMSNKPVYGQAKAVDGWSHKGGPSELGLKLIEAARNEYLIQGIPCSCCNRQARDELSVRCLGNQTFANVFINGNHESFIKRLRLLDRPVYLIASQRATHIDRLPCNINGVYQVPDDCVNVFEERYSAYRETMSLIASVWRESLILVAAGPMGTVFVHWMQQSNPNVQAIDVGSALDQFIFGHDTRPYHKPGNPYRKRVCVQ